jgi:hypothetical protein
MVRYKVSTDTNNNGNMTNTRKTNKNQENNNSIQFFIIYVPSQQPQGQLQAQHSVGTNNNIMSKPNIKSKSNER